MKMICPSSGKTCGIECHHSNPHFQLRVCLNSCEDSNGNKTDGCVRYERKLIPKKRKILCKNKTIGIVGTRRRDTMKDLVKVEREFLKHYNEGDIICSGLCKSGADRFAVVFQKKYKTKYPWFPAEWNKYGKRAGFIRNTDIAENSDILIACVAPDRKGGTEDTIKKFINFHEEENLFII